MKKEKFVLRDKIEMNLRRKRKMKDGIILIGDAIIETRKKDGTVVEHEEVKNMIVNTGKEHVAKLLGGIGTGITEFTHIAVGISETGDSVVAGDTALKNEVAREEATRAYLADYKCTFEKTFSFGTGESYDIKEAGIFDSGTVTGSIMLDRFVFNAKSVDNDTDLYVKITITVAGA